MVGDQGRDRDPISAGPWIAFQSHILNRDVLGIGRRKIDARQDRALRKLDHLGSVPPDLLKVADEDDLAARPVGPFEDPARHFERTRVARRARTQLGRGEARIEGSAIGGPLVQHLSPLGEQHQRGPVVRAHAVDRAASRLERALPVVPVAHAVGSIDQNHYFTSPRQRHSRFRRALEQRACESRHEQHDRQTAEREQQPVPYPLPAHGPERDLAYKHQGGERNDVLASALREMDDHGDRQGGQPGQDERGQERDPHQRTRLSCSRRDRYLNRA